MKILHLNYYDLSGGASIAAYRIHKSLIKESVNSSMYVSEKKINDRNIILSNRSFIDKINIRLQRKLHRINSNKNIYKVSKSYNLLPSFKIREINSLKADIINLHWIGNNFLSIREISKLNAPVVWTVHDMWPYCGSEHYTNQNRYIDGYNKFNGLKNKKIFSFDLDKIVWNIKKKYFKKIHFVATSTWQEKQLKKSFLFKEQNISKIYYPLDSNKWKKSKKNKLSFGNDKSLKKILFISDRIDNPLKGFSLIKKLFDKSDKEKYLLIIIGNKNKENFKNLNINYRFFNKIENKEKLIDIFSSVDLLIAPSIKESFGIVAQEAAFCNTPSVVFKDTGFEDTIKHKVNGYVAENNNLKDFKKGIIWCLNNQNLIKISRNSRLINIRKFNMQKIANNYIQLYKSILNKN